MDCILIQKRCLSYVYNDYKKCQNEILESLSISGRIRDKEKLHSDFHRDLYFNLLRTNTLREMDINQEMCLILFLYSACCFVLRCVMTIQYFRYRYHNRWLMMVERSGR